MRQEGRRRVEVRQTRHPSEGAQHRRAGQDQQQEREHPAGEVPDRRRDEVVPRVVRQVHRRRRALLEAQPVAVQPERPEPQVHQRAVEQPEPEPEERQHHDLGAPAHPRQRAGQEADPAGGHHLERQPRPHAAGDQRPDEQREAALHEAEAAAEDPAAEHDHRERRLQPGHARRQRPERAADRGEHAEQRDRLGVDAAGVELGDHDRGHQRQHQGEHPRRVRAVRRALAAARRVEQERPAERRHRHHRGQHQRQGGAGVEADRA